MFCKTVCGLLALSGLSSLGVVNSELVGPITITENGESVTRYVVSTYAAAAQTSGSSLTMQNGANVQIANYSSDDYDPYMFVRYNLDGVTLSFTADYSGVGCSCNGAFYFVTMPALDDNGNPTGGDSGNYYCDANDVNGEWCWELDIMEANMYVSQTTPHSCDQSPGQPTYSCDGGGCGTNSYYTDSGGFCPSDSCTINTQSAFEYSITFSSTDYHVTFSQNGQTFEFDACGDSGYLSNMQQALDFGMTLILSSWGDSYDTMSWLDDMTGCTGDCDTSGSVTFSDISISSSGDKDLIVDWDTYKNNVMKAKELKKSSNVNSIANHEFMWHEGKLGTKEKLSVPKKSA